MRSRSRHYPASLALSRHQTTVPIATRIFCRHRPSDVLCRYKEFYVTIEEDLSPMQTQSRHCPRRDLVPRGLSRDREPLVATLIAQSQPQPFHDIEILSRHKAENFYHVRPNRPRRLVTRTHAWSCAWPACPIVTRNNLSRHSAQETLSLQTFSVATEA